MNGGEVEEMDCDIRHHVFKGGESIAIEYAFLKIDTAHYYITRHGGIRGLKVSCEHGLNRIGGLSKCLIQLQLLEIA